MSNPYGGAQEPGEQPSYQPYGSSPYSGGPYSGGPYGGSSATGHGTDGVSIAGFVLSLLCCTSVIGLILGIVGIGRTRNGVRKGRWAAVAAIVVGAIGTLAFVGMIVFFVWFGTSTVQLSDAEAGQCVNVDEFADGHDSTLFEKDCDEPHEAEIVAAGVFDSEQADSVVDEPEAVCAKEAGSQYAAAIAAGDYTFGITFDASEPEPGDRYACYLERADGNDLDEPLSE